MTKVTTILATAILCISYIDCKGINVIENNRQGRASTDPTFFWVITVKAFDFPADPSSLNTKAVKDSVAKELQDPICGAANTGCMVKVLSFTKGSTNINGETTHTAGQNIKPNVQNNVVAKGVTITMLGGNPATSSSVSDTNFALCVSGLGSGTDGKCIADEGDCDDDNQCEGSLKCGVNNCGTGFDPLADCCYDPAKVKKSETCDGGSTNMWTCCRDRSEGCNVKTDPDCGCKQGQGDCDNDEECAGGLVCGRNSCDTAFNNNFKDSKKFFPSGQADCCITKSRALFYGRPSRADLEENFQNDEEPF